MNEMNNILLDEKKLAKLKKMFVERMKNNNTSTATQDKAKAFIERLKKAAAEQRAKEQ